MKVFLKFIIICIVLCIALILINTIRNIYIINNILERSNQYFSDITSYKGKIESYSSYSSENNIEKTLNVVNTDEFFYKDNIYLLKRYKNSQIESILWKNTNTNEFINTANETDDITDKFIYTDIMKIDFIINENFKNNKLKLYLFNFIKSDNQNYIITSNENEYYYNKENGILTKFYLDDSRYEIYSIEKNLVTDEELMKPSDI